VPSISRADRRVPQALLISILLIGPFAQRGLTADLREAAPVEGSPDALEETGSSSNERHRALSKRARRPTPRKLF
jgi:hypothetical protein